MKTFILSTSSHINNSPDRYYESRYNLMVMMMMMMLGLFSSASTD